ncbi:tyrosine-type recombinase/integrase [Roseinatronobacter bogoriensis]|uniref:Integrase n=1 Tax=Roseinatronobacter bogoriensis subsp. barguzinensis TaxID=441209 RepID=A0A2K8K6Z1_9RHOB|nr:MULTISPECIES: integrase arm-type DNA-binding domain-containing protein [Rhodobaca]ATX65232.1 integrase [Rhodobaca barguzinensis]MBB4209332.1 integrase [Rhodobaca bogoriensis DSM 18756]TDW34334.1 integrase [Rhodobaca barguzinensis]TDY67075.1 integrase [Rhodobaca bogoriensis DSM 18756]
MPRIAKELSAIAVRNLRHPGFGGNVTHAVGGVTGLYLQITPNGARSWLLRYVANGSRHSMGLGPFPEVSLARAREKARDAREIIRAGDDPLAEKRAEQEARRAQVTFANAAEQTVKAKEDGFRNEKHRKQWRATLDTYAAPILGEMPVADIKVNDVKRVLEPIWTTKTETATRLRGRIEAVLAWATVHGHRTGDNPARWKGNLDASLPKPKKGAKVKNHPALTLDDAPAWFADLRKRHGFATRALEFAALTAARSGEVRGATWDEIDLELGAWTIPAERMKAEKEHRVPLSAAAKALLEGMDRMGDSPYLFPAARGGPLSDMALSACMKRLNEAREGGYLDARSKRPAVPHGLRSTFRDWAAERTEYPAEMAEMALAHQVGSAVERAYRRTDMMEKRRDMMEDWARFLGA